MKTRVCALNPLWVTVLAVVAGTGLRGQTLNFDIPQPVIIPDSGVFQGTVNSTAAPAISSVDLITISIGHEWLGDVTLKVVPPTGTAFVLIDQVGVTAADVHGSSAILGSYVPTGDPNNPAFLLVPQTYQFAASGVDVSTEAQNVVANQDPPVLSTNKVYKAQTWPAGPFPAGTWQLVIGDNADLSGGSVSAASLNYTGPATLSVNWGNPGDIIYGTPLGPGQLNASATAGGAAVAGTFSYSPPLGTVLAAGNSRTLSVTFTPQGPTSFSPVTTTVRINVKPAPLTVTADDKSATYGSPLPSLTLSFVGFVNGDGPTSLTQSVTPVSLATAGSPAGVYPIMVSGGASPNYSISFKNGTLTINKAPLYVTADNQGVAYGVALPALTATYNGFVNGDTMASLVQPVTLTTTATVGSPQGVYPIIASGGVSPNYSFVLNNGTLTIAQAILTVTADSKTKVYGAAIPQLTVTYSGFAPGDSVAELTQPVTASTLATASSPAGTYPIVVSGGASSKYVFVTKSGSLTISKAPLSVTADNKTVTYGAPLPALTATYTGFVNGDTAASLVQPVSLATTATATSPIGVYPITASGGLSPNYTFSVGNGSLSIIPALLTVTADNKSKVYGAALPQLTATYNGFVHGDTPALLTQPPALSTSATASSPAGTYPITITGGVAGNYMLVPQPGQLTVTKASLTVTADNKSVNYGAPLPSLTASYAGLVNGDTAASFAQLVSVTSAANANSSPGSYPITVSLAATPNYAVTVRNGTLTINKAVLTVTADDQTAVYGGALPPLTATYSGFVNGDTAASIARAPTVVTTAAPGSPAGKYPITVSGGISANYTLAPKNGTLIISRAPLTVTADAKSKAYGASLPTLTATYAGFVNGDTLASLTQPPTLATAATASSAAGSYPIVLTGGVSPNYNFVLQSGTLTVTKAQLVVTVGNSSKVYGAALPAFTASYSGFVNGDTLATALTQPVSFTTTATATSPVGTYPVTAAGSASPSYNLVPKNGTLTITKAPLTIKATDATMTAGSSLPTFDATYSGFLNGDSAANLSGILSFATTATSASPPGKYPIIPKGVSAANYAISFSSGTLSVTPATVQPVFAANVARNGAVSIAAFVSPGTNVRLEASTDLRTWVEVGNQATPTGLVQFDGGDVRTHPIRFFRLVTP